ncbi:helix-turn-helix domain-containing protein [Mucilaginibacter ginsenosidivorax]|uniref:Helix-turn-helix domain-containing protein n=1 Tax=Mucilaginibacter ginsenosidivorax TaxID=862126 RepID=A0A5B8VTH8_9SPHI|nr:helix-turn-helix domain-containing protein [Mucilaginibacter ginsenosidivorax]QEC74583.1 helix-turn-helix domain-containing protein [Mucilaginibacter ginsenosidivorax]
MSVELITKEDLETFRRLLLNDIKLLLSAKPDDNKTWLRCSDVRRMLKISTGTVQNLRVSGKLKSQKVGGIHFYKLTDVENMISGKNK